MVLRSHEVKASNIPLRARRGGTASLVLKTFLITGTVGLLVWTGNLPDDDSEPPVAWDVLLVALLAAAFALLVLRLLRRTEPLMPCVARGVRRFRGNGPVVDAVAAVLATLAVFGYLLTFVMMLAAVVAAVVWNGRLPVAVGVGPLCVSVGATIGLWAMGRVDFPDGD